MDSEKVKVATIDDEEDALELLSYFLGQMPDVKLVAKYHNAAEAIRGLRLIKEKPDIIFTDISMPGFDGIEMTRHIKSLIPELEFVFVTAHNHYAPETRNLNPIGFLQKPIETSELKHCIRLFLSLRKDKG